MIFDCFAFARIIPGRQGVGREWFPGIADSLLDDPSSRNCNWDFTALHPAYAYYHLMDSRYEAIPTVGRKSNRAVSGGPRAPSSYWLYEEMSPDAIRRTHSIKRSAELMGM